MINPTTPKPRKQRPRTDKYGTKKWFLNRKLHREDGPAVEFKNGQKEWYINGQRHREGDPALIDCNGNKWWYQNGLVHREDGPGCEFVNGDVSWYYHSNYIQATSLQDFKRQVDQFK